ncbi:MAG: hypothetical protein RQ748_03220 [Elusimicrobiales bacterium]|nr:hypothetical protein [Elusimicrobiales bacterium]
MLRIILALMMPLQAAAEGWPVFDLNDGPARGRVATSDHVWVPPVPEPIPVTAKLEEPASSETMPVFSPYKHGTVSVRSSVRIKVKKDKGEAVLTFPRVSFGEPGPGDRARLYIRVGEGGDGPASVSWATAICHGAHYLGYKGSTFTMPRGSGDFTVSETLAMGHPKAFIKRTHPWLFGKGLKPDDICSAKAGEALESFDAERLPPSAGGAELRYDAREQVLTVIWKR